MSACHTGNPLVFEAQGVKVYAGGNTRNGGWMQMEPKPDLAIGPQGVIRTARTMDKFPTGWLCGSKVTTKKTPLLIELEWPDYSIPTNVGRDFWVQLVEDIKTNDIKSVSTQCMGGHGRTGVQLCILAHMMIPVDQHTWKDAGELIQYIRDVYCHHAVEAPSQQKYIADVLEIPSGENKIAIKSTVSNDIWSNVEYSFDPDEVTVDDDISSRKSKRKSKGKKGNGNGKAKSYTLAPPKSTLVKSHTLFQCERCEDYEFRATNSKAETCEVCNGEVHPAEESLDDSTGDRVSCRSCQGEYHPLEMYSMEQCKACWLDENDPKKLVMESPKKLSGRFVKCASTGKKVPMVFTLKDGNSLIAADKSRNYKKAITFKKSKTTLESFMDMDDDADIEYEISKSKDVDWLLGEFDRAKAVKDKRLMEIIGQRMEELYL